jgi:oxygen-independent coproporphyrinogen-3 oxidase
MLQEGYGLLKKTGYNPYYIYRQKNMVDRGENVGYEKAGTLGLYNIRMMEDVHEILSIGSNAASKKIRQGKAIRIATPKDIHLYMKDKERRKRLIEEMFV